MVKKGLIILLTYLLLCAAEIGFAGSSSSPAESSGTNRPKWVPGEVIVKFRTGLSEHRINQINRRYGGTVLYTSPFGGFKRMKVPAGRTAEQMVGLYSREPDVEYAELNYYARALFVPNDPGYPYQWHLNSPWGINIEPVWDITGGDPNVIVAVLDSGAAYEDYPAPAHWHVSSYQAYNGNSWWCGLNKPDWASPPGYGDGWKDYLQHSFDLTGASGTITFSYQYRHDLELTRGVPYDKAFTEISTDDGESWTTLTTYTGMSKVKGKVGWKAEVLDLSSYAGSHVLIRFRVFTDEIYSDADGNFDSDGALFVDDIKLEDDSGVLFYDDVESGPGTWETTRYEQAPDLGGTLFVNGRDFVNGDDHANDDDGHGTHVTGTIAQSTDNGMGVAGVAHNTAIMPVKILDAAGYGTYHQIADGIYYAVDNGADVINMSLGGGSPAQTLENAVAYAYNNGVTVVAACGNSNAPSCDYPAAYNAYVIAVGATQYDGGRAPYSSYGTGLDLVAPGGNTGIDQNGDGDVDGVLQQTFSDTPVDWDYWYYEGTSMATPHVTGVAALLIATGVDGPDAVREALQNTARDLGPAGWDEQYGWGLVDAYAALDYYHIPGDFDYSGSLDFDDLARLAAYWLDYDALVDIAPEGGDGIINFLDFAEFAGGW
ncbi:MAG: S8 family peptidase [Planctomycetota bacterium]